MPEGSGRHSCSSPTCLLNGVAMKRARHVAETIVALVVVQGAAIVLVPLILLSWSGQEYFELLRPIGLMEVLSLLAALVGLAMIVWVAYTFVAKGRGTPSPFDPPRQFVAQGLFRYVRNPMYLGMLLVLVSEALFFRSSAVALYAAGAWAAAQTFLVVFEEPQLEQRFGEPYRQYLSSTPRWIPRRPRV